MLSPMNTSNEDVIIRKSVAAAIEIIAQNTPLREAPVKSTYVVKPEHHRHIDTIGKVTGQTKQDLYSSAVDYYLKHQLFLDDIPLEQVKALAAL